MSQTFLIKSSCKCFDLEPIALIGHDAVLTEGASFNLIKKARFYS